MRDSGRGEGLKIIFFWMNPGYPPVLISQTGLDPIRGGQALPMMAPPFTRLEQFRVLLRLLNGRLRQNTMGAAKFSFSVSLCMNVPSFPPLFLLIHTPKHTSLARPVPCLGLECVLLYELPPMTHSFTCHCSFKSQFSSLGRLSCPSHEDRLYRRPTILTGNPGLRESWIQSLQYTKPFQFITIQPHVTHNCNA